jgi:hypothetical protein
MSTISQNKRSWVVSLLIRLALALALPYMQLALTPLTSNTLCAGNLIHSWPTCKTYHVKHNVPLVP